MLRVDKRCHELGVDDPESWVIDKLNWMDGKVYAFAKWLGVTPGSLLYWLRLKGYVWDATRKQFVEAYTLADKEAVLTTAQRNVLDAIKVLQKSLAYPPSQKDIADHLGYKSISTAHFHLVHLRALGFVDWIDGKARTLRVYEDGA